MNEASAKEKLAEYMDAARHARSLDGWWGCFMTLAAYLPGVGVEGLQPEKHAHESREHMIWGNLVFEFRGDLHQRWEDVNQPLKQCLAHLKAQQPNTIFTAIATNGLGFHLYTPHFDDAGKVAELETVGGLNLTSPMMTPETAIRQLDDILSILRG